MKSFLLGVIALFVSYAASAQSTVAEIEWYSQQSYYRGLLVLYPNNQGMFYVRYSLPGVGDIFVQQQAALTYTYDMYGNCTNYLYCANPSTVPYTPYAADNFIFYPNGSVYTQDYAGNWSTAVQYRVVPPGQWAAVYRRFGLN